MNNENNNKIEQNGTTNTTSTKVKTNSHFVKSDLSKEQENTHQKSRFENEGLSCL